MISRMQINVIRMSSAILYTNDISFTLASSKTSPIAERNPCSPAPNHARNVASYSHRCRCNARLIILLRVGMPSLRLKIAKHKFTDAELQN